MVVLIEVVQLLIKNKWRLISETTISKDASFQRVQSHALLGYVLDFDSFLGFLRHAEKCVCD